MPTAAQSTLPAETRDADVEYVEVEPPALRAPIMQAELDACRLDLPAIEAEIAELALADAEGKPIPDAALVALHDKRKALQFRIEVKTLGHELAVQMDKQALASWKEDVLSLDPDDIADGVTPTKCCDICAAGAGCALSGFRQCLHPATFTRFPSELQQLGVDTAAWRAASQIIRTAGDDE